MLPPEDRCTGRDAAPTRRVVSMMVSHPDGSVSTQVFMPTGQQFDDLLLQLAGSTGGLLYHRHIPADEIRRWAPHVGRLGVVVA